jgi:predicted DNA-binding transcriptional regulator AlpA
MPTKKKIRPEPETVYVSAPQVRERYGGRSHMWLVRVLARDPSFPRPSKFGRLNFFKVAELVEWERAQAARTVASTRQSTSDPGRAASAA